MAINYNEEDFKNNLNKILEESNCFLIFYANWCSDCTNIEKFTSEFEKICKSKNLDFYRINVGEKDHFRNSQNFFTNLKKINLKKIPTGMIFNKGVIQEKLLIEKDFLDESKRNEFFN